MTAPPATDRVLVVPLLRQWWWAFAGSFVVGAVFGVALIGQMPPAYSTTVEVLVGPVVPDARTLEGSADLARTFGEVVESRRTRAAATAGTGIDPDAVVVSAEAGRGSSTLTIEVQTPSAADTTQIALGVVEALRDVVDDGRPSVQREALEGLDDDDRQRILELLAPSGSEVVVIDDGGGLVEDQSLGTSIGAAFGGLAGMLVAASAVLALERRRQHDPRIAVIEETIGTDLGRLELAPVLSEFLGRRHLSVAAEAIATRPTLGLELPSTARKATIVFVTTRTDHRNFVEALLQLALVLDDPPLIIDPDDTIGGHDSRDLLPGVLYELRAQGALDAHLLVPKREWTLLARTPSAVRRLCRSVEGDHSVILVCVPAGDGHPNWRPWAAGADHALVLARQRDLDQHLRRLGAQVRAVQPSVLGGVRIRRRWLFGGPARRVGFEPRSRVDLPDDYDTGRRRPDPLALPAVHES